MRITKIEPKYRIALLITLSIVSVVVYVLYTDHANEHLLDAKLNRVLYVSWGDDREVLTYRPRNGDCCGVNEGPKSFFVLASDIYILDNVRNRVNVYNHNRFVKELPLHDKSYPVDMYLSNDAIYLLSDFSLEKLSFNGALVAKNLTVRNTEALKYNVGRVFVYKDFVIIHEFESSKGHANACFNGTDLKEISCAELGSIFTNYDVVDIAGERIYVLLDDGTLGYMENGNSGRVSDIKRLLDMSNASMYPTAAKYRINHGKLYFLEEENNGLGIYEHTLSVN